MEDPDMVQAEAGYLGQILAGVRRVEVVPGVEPTAARRVVDAEAERRNGILPRSGLALTLLWLLFCANVSTTIVSDEQ
jgi:hypothetical protein